MRINGLYPGPATAPGWNWAGGKPLGPGTAIRVGLKSGAPWKWTSAGPNGFCAGVGLSMITVCTQAGQPMPILASLGAKFTPRSCASPASEASRRTNQAVLPYASPLYSGRRTVSLLRSTWMALSSVRWSLGSRPPVCPSPPGWSLVTADADLTPCPIIPGTRATSVATSITAISAISTRLFARADLKGRCSILIVSLLVLVVLWYQNKRCRSRRARERHLLFWYHNTTRTRRLTIKMEHRPFRSARANKRVLIALIAVILVATLVALVPGIIGHGVRSASAVTKDQPGGLGQTGGLLPRDHLTEESAIQVDLSNEMVRLPLYKGEAYGKTAWFVLLDASDAGLAHDLRGNFAPKLAHIGIGCPACVQTVTLDNPTPAQNPFGQALVHFQGAPDFSPTRIAVPGPNGFPLAKFHPGAVAGPGDSPVIHIPRSPVLHNAPNVATA